MSTIPHRPLLAEGDPRHGSYYGYVLGCRCEECKAANARYSKDRYHRRKAAKEQEAK